MSKYTTVEGVFFVKIEKAPKTEDIQSSSNTASALKTFKKAIIKHTFDEEKFPIDSEWIMGEAPGMNIIFFGEEITVIQEKDLYARIN